jgi:hypothetical protein
LKDNSDAIKVLDKISKDSPFASGNSRGEMKKDTTENIVKKETVKDDKNKTNKEWKDKKGKNIGIKKALNELESQVKTSSNITDEIRTKINTKILEIRDLLK